VAFVDTRYEVMAVAETEAEAIRLACERALQFLTDRDAVVVGRFGTDSVDKIREYFGVIARPVQVGTAVLID